MGEHEMFPPPVLSLLTMPSQAAALVHWFLPAPGGAWCALLHQLNAASGHICRESTTHSASSQPPETDRLRSAERAAAPLSDAVEAAGDHCFWSAFDASDDTAFRDFDAAGGRPNLLSGLC